MFGHQIEGERVCYWGARAIFERGNIDLLHDRQSGDANDGLVNWLNARALPWLRERVKEIGLATNDPQEIVLSEFKYELRASTHASYGYLYIGAVEWPQVPCEPHINTATKVEEPVVSCNGQMFVVDPGMAEVGTEGVVKVNGIGPAKVVGYYNENYADPYKLACLMVVMLSPPDWWIAQRQEDEIRKLVKSGKMPAKRGTKPEHGVGSPAAVKEYRKNWKPSPCPIWSNDFKTDKAEAA